MNTQHLDDSGRELGVFSIVLPVVWAIVAVVGFALIANWPELFAASAQAAPVSAPEAAAVRAGTESATPEPAKALRVLDSATVRDALPAIALLGAREQMLTALEAMPQTRLKAAFLSCDQASTQRVLDLGEAMPCAMAWDALLKREFGGNLDAMLAWWRARRDDAVGVELDATAEIVR